ncbi:hypothetical protein V8F06_013680 [Rhypophila decipiens]
MHIPVWGVVAGLTLLHGAQAVPQAVPLDPGPNMEADLPDPKQLAICYRLTLTCINWLQNQVIPMARTALETNMSTTALPDMKQWDDCYHALFICERQGQNCDMRTESC